jgi:hypothetical protein
LNRPTVRRLLFVPAVLAGVVAVAFAANPAWARSAGLDVWNAAELAREKEEVIEQGRELAAVDDEICRRIAVKEAVVRDVIDGRTTLADATAQFMALNEPYPANLRMIRETYPGSTDEEKTARNVICYTLGRVDDPDERDWVAHRLQEELQAVIAGRVPAAE